MGDEIVYAHAAERQQQNTKANFYVSTIHSAKGLEFDNVVVLYQNKRDMEEADKRMYYVAFTRAMQSEFIAVYDTIKNRCGPRSFGFCPGPCWSRT